MIQSNSGSKERLLATVQRLDLAHLPLGSAESRAAARRLLKTKKAIEPKGNLFVLLDLVNPPGPEVECHCKQPRSGTFAICECFFQREEPQRVNTSKG